MQYLSVKNFDRYQHFKRKRPSWVKLYLSMLDDHAFSKLKLNERAVYLELLLVASTCENKIPYDPGYLQQAMKTTESLKDILPSLLKSNFLACTSVSVSPSVSVSVSVSEALHSEPSEHPVSQIVSDKLTVRKDDGFEAFWAIYPRKVGRGAALQSWKRMKCGNDTLERICSQVEAAKKTDQWTRDGGKYIPLPATWLNQSRWEDDYSTTTPVKQDGFRERMNKLAKGEAL